ncbi:MAG: Ig-like domain-containing protein, partial [Verrucomicrobiota bacterium JB025]|nr:Ig-like domain-containing protein [Verrucomicrobiota bacterium JB025]
VANDGTEDSEVATVTIFVAAVNEAPVATPQSDVPVDEDSSVAITLAGTDVDEDSLTFTVTVQPANGVLSGTAPDLTYTPNENYNGADSFSFVVNDGADDSDAATVTIDVASVNDKPVATPITGYPVAEDTPTAITIGGTDVDGDSLTFTVTVPPANGVLSGTAPDLTYTPSENYNGPDSFSFIVNDGTEDSDPALVTIDVNEGNDAPVATPQTDVPVLEDTATGITLAGTDTDEDSLTFTVTVPPTNGVLSGTAPDLTYTPNENYNGPDSFSFIVNDGFVDSEPAVVSIVVSPVNDAPVATPQSDVPVDEDSSVAITLAGTDVDEDSLTFTVTVPPTNGVLSGTAPDLTYTPNENYNGADSFSFVANDGTEDSDAATVTITVAPVNDAPVATPQTDVPVDEDSSVAITLAGTDVDEDSLTFTVTVQPANGVLSGTAPDLTYTPNADYNGADSFSFIVNDGAEDSDAATVTIEVAAVNDKPVATPQSDVPVDEDSSVAITLAGTDVDEDSLTFTVTVPPANGVLSGTAPDLTYTPNAGYDGPDSFSFVANDGTEDSDPAVVTITVNDVVSDGFSEWLAEFGTASNPGSDPDNDRISNAVEFVIGGDPVNENDTGLLPTIALETADPDGNTVDDDYLVFTYRRSDRANNDSLTTIGVQWSGTLFGSWADAATTDGVVVIEEDDGFEAGIDRVMVYIPRSLGVDGRIFARLVVSVDVETVNLAPSATPQSVTVDAGGSLSITLSGTDPENDPLTYSVVTQPANGVLTGTAPNLTYTPNDGYDGADSFTFTVNDGNNDSAPATVSITVEPLAGFTGWMGDNGLSGVAANVDSDGDGLSNAVEYVLGGIPSGQSNAGLRPTIQLVTADPDNDTVSSDYVLFTYRRTDVSNDDPSTASLAQWSTTLTGGWTNAEGTPGSVTVVDDDGAGAGVDLVNVYIPRSLAVDGRLFGRLVVTVDETP